VHGVALLSCFLEVLIDCMRCGMCCFVVSWDVLHAIVSIESHGRQKDTTFVVAMFYLEISVVLVIYKYQVLCYILEDVWCSFL
jgi:Fe-S-cluster containining protein